MKEESKKARYRQITCATSIGIQKSDITSPFDTRFDIPPGKAVRMCDIKGPGRIVRLWITLPVRFRGSVLRNAVLRMFWDNESEPSVECPLGDFFGACFGKPHHLDSECLTIAGGGYVSHFEMSFMKRAIMEVENQSDRPIRLFFYEINYYEEGVAEQNIEMFHAQWQRQNPTIKDKPFVALDARGKGRFVGIKMDLQNRSWWLKPPLFDLFFPRGLGLGMLEGPEKIHIDEEEPPSIVGTGSEDYFQGGWYFKGGPFQTPRHGVIVRSYFSGRVSPYRFFTGTPISFEKSFKLSFDHGIRNDVKTDYSSVVYWYQIEPHAAFPKLLPTKMRRPEPCWMNLLQPLLGLGILTILLAIAIYLLIKVIGLQ